MTEHGNESDEFRREWVKALDQLPGKVSFVCPPNLSFVSRRLTGRSYVSAGHRWRG